MARQNRCTRERITITITKRFLLGSVIVVSLLIVVVSILHYGNIYCHYSALKYNEENSNIYDGSLYDDIIIPDGVTLNFARNLKVCKNNFASLETFMPYGVYYYDQKSIFILENLTTFQKKKVLIHELSHHQYEGGNLSPDVMNSLSVQYGRWCASEDEFNAYINEWDYAENIDDRR